MLLNELIWGVIDSADDAAVVNGAWNMNIDTSAEHGHSDNTYFTDFYCGWG